MREKFAAWEKKLKKIKKWLGRKRVKKYIGGVIIALLFVFTCLVSINRESNPDEEKYKLVDTFWVTPIFKAGTKEEPLCFFFFYDNKERRFTNIDLIICLDKWSRIFLIREVDEKGKWHRRSSLPTDFPSDKVPKIKRIPKHPEKEKIRRSRNEKGITRFERKIAGHKKIA